VQIVEQALVRAFYHVPVIGWLTRDAVHGSPDAKYYFIGNVAVALAALIFYFGYPLVITLALIGSALGLSGIVMLTMGDWLDTLGAPVVTEQRPVRRSAAVARPTRKAA
jgi:hypothetical protein